MNCTLCGKAGSLIWDGEDMSKGVSVLLVYYNGKAVCNCCTRDVVARFARQSAPKESSK